MSPANLCRGVQWTPAQTIRCCIGSCPRSGRRPMVAPTSIEHEPKKTAQAQGLCCSVIVTSRREMSDKPQTSDGAGRNFDYARGGSPHICQLKQSMKRKARKSQRMGSEKTKRQKKRAGLQQTKHVIAKECSPKKNA